MQTTGLNGPVRQVVDVDYKLETGTGQRKGDAGMEGLMDQLAL